MRIAILQSSYIPWKGYFDLIHSVDEFVLFDDVQFTRRDWRNRNRIKTAAGPAWLTIPVNSKGQYLAPIKADRRQRRSWAVRHWRTLTGNYAQSAVLPKLCRPVRAALPRVPRNAPERDQPRVDHRHLRDSRHPHQAVLVHGLRARRRARPSGWLESAGRRVRRPTCPDRRREAISQPEIFQAAGVELIYFELRGLP